MNRFIQTDARAESEGARLGVVGKVREIHAAANVHHDVTGPRDFAVILDCGVLSSQQLIRHLVPSIFETSRKLCHCNLFSDKGDVTGE